MITVIYFQSKSGKRTGTTSSGKLDAAKELGLVDKGNVHGGAHKKPVNNSSTKRQKNFAHDSNSSRNSKKSNGDHHT